MNRFFIGSVLILLTLIAGATAVVGQFRSDPFRVNSSTLIDQIKALRTANPKMSASDLATAADAILEKTGLPFSFWFDTATCDKLRKARDAQKDRSAPFRLSTTLKSVDADKAGLALPELKFSSEECGGCGIELPILQLTDADFVTIVNGRNIKFVRPSNFHSNEAMLVDLKDQAVVKRKWRIPFRSVPIGVSFDENVVYFAFSEPEFNDLALAVFGEGVFQISTRAEAEEGGKGKLLPGMTGNAWQTVRFDRWNQTYLINFRPPCGR